MMSMSSSASSFGALLLITLVGRTTASNTQYVCNGNEFCTLKSNGGLCSPTAKGLPFGNTFSTTLSGAGSTAGMSYACIAFPNYDLVSGGGSCIMECPASCTVTQNVAFPCQDSSGGTGSSMFGEGSGSSGSGGMFGGDSSMFGDSSSGSGTSGSSTTATTTSTEGNSGGGNTIVSGGTDAFGTTEFVCKSGSYCTLSSTGGICSPIGKGLLDGKTFIPTVMSSSSTTVPYDCIGFSNSDLVSGGGSCQMSCPDTCTVTPDVTNPCGSGGAGDTGDGGSSSAIWHAVSSVVASLVIAGVVAVIG